MLKRKQRIRMERGRDRAERVGEKVERKRGDRDGGGRKGRGRRRGVSLIFFSFFLILVIYFPLF